MINDYRVPEYGSQIQKVMPKSRDQNPMGLHDSMGAPNYSSKPTPDQVYQSIAIDQRAEAEAHDQGPSQAYGLAVNGSAPNSNNFRNDMINQAEQ